MAAEAPMRIWSTALVGALLALPTQAAELSPADRAAVEERLRTYADAWRANDAGRVVANFTGDAVLMPHHGFEPVVGLAAIKRFWFPADSPPTRVTRFDRTADEIVGTGDMAFVRGHFVLEYRYGEPGNEKKLRNAGTFIALLRKRSGQWLITHHMWDDPPVQPNVTQPFADAHPNLR
jgi:uncharacterized protein (TIGR02246 family)